METDTRRPRLMPLVIHDGGRAACGFKGTAGDCVTRSIAIATGHDYQRVYGEFQFHTQSQRARSRGKTNRSPRAGVPTGRQWFKNYMAKLGWEWVPTMRIGSGCQVHLRAAELPMGTLIVSVSRHYTVVIDRVVYDTHDPQRDGMRCVYGYWREIPRSAGRGLQ